MLTIETLRALGADTDEGLKRCMNNEAFYLRLVKMAAGDAGFDKLADALSAGDRKAAFEAAHALKGILGNLSLTPLYRIASEMTELLRAGTDTDCAPYLQELKTLREKLLALMAEG